MQWTPNLIWFDNATSYNTPNYYVQQLFSLNKGTDVVSLTKDGKAICGQDSCWASAVIDRTNNELVIKLVNMSSSAKTKIIQSDQTISGNAIQISLASVNTGVMNSIGNPDNIKPETKTLQVKGKQLQFTAAPFSMNVVKVKLK